MKDYTSVANHEPVELAASAQQIDFTRHEDCQFSSYRTRKAWKTERKDKTTGPFPDQISAGLIVAPVKRKNITFQ